MAVARLVTTSEVVMAKVHGGQGQLVMGMSQQPADIRDPQHTAFERNTRHTLANGTERRPPCEYVATIDLEGTADWEERWWSFDAEHSHVVRIARDTGGTGDVHI